MKVLQDFSVFIETVRQGSITQAANILNVTPAAVSATIKRLKNSLIVRYLYAQLAAFA